MKKIKFEYQFLLLFYAYLRQMDLSLDRSRWGKWTDLRIYYNDKLNPIKLAEILKNRSQLNLELNPDSALFPNKKPTVTEIINSIYLRVLHKEYYLSANEIEYCYRLLYKFNDLLNSDLDGYYLNISNSQIDLSKFYIENFRHEVVDFYTKTLGIRLIGKDLRSAMNIEHYLQSESISHSQIQSFINSISFLSDTEVYS